MNGFWRAFVDEITEGVTVKLPQNDGYEIDIINFAKYMYIENAFVPLVRDRSHPLSLLMPGDGFCLIMKKR